MLQIRNLLSIFRIGNSNVVNSEGGAIKQGLLCVVGNSECHVAHVLVLVVFLFFCRHLVCSQRRFHKGVWPRSRLQSRAGKSMCKGWAYLLLLYVLSFIIEKRARGC
jgi:hypothetical protein